MPPELTQIHKEAWIAFFVAHAVLRRKIDRALVDRGLPTLEVYDFLLTLEGSPFHRLKMSEVADKLLLSRSGITRLVDRLEAEGLVERHACSGDRRSLYAVLTDKGLALRKEAWVVYREQIQALFASRMSEQEAEILKQVFLRVLQDEPVVHLHGMPRPCG